MALSRGSQTVHRINYFRKGFDILKVADHDLFSFPGDFTETFESRASNYQRNGLFAHDKGGDVRHEDMIPDLQPFDDKRGSL